MSEYETVPEHALRRLDSGRLQLEAILPGVQSAQDITFVIKDRSISVRIDGLYRLELPLGVPVLDNPQSVKYIRKKSLLRAILLVEDSQSKAQPSGSTNDGAAHSSQTPPPVLSTRNGHHSDARIAPDEAAVLGGMPTEQPASPVPDVTADEALQDASQSDAVGSAARVNGAGGLKRPGKAGAGQPQQESPTTAQRRSGMRRGFFDSPATAVRPTASSGSGNGGTLAPEASPVQQPATASTSGSPSVSESPATHPVATSISNSAPDTAESDSTVAAAQMPAQRPAAPDFTGEATSPSEAPITETAADGGGSGSASEPETEGPSTPKPTVPQTPSVEEDDIYHAAKVRQNQEAAAEAAAVASLLMRSGSLNLTDTKRAINLLEKAVRLAPGNAAYETQLCRAMATADLLRSQASPSPQPPAAGASGYGSGWGTHSGGDTSGNAGGDSPQTGAGSSRREPPSPTASSTSRFDFDEQSQDDMPHSGGQDSKRGSAPTPEEPPSPKKPKWYQFWRLTEQEFGALPQWQKIVTFMVIVACHFAAHTPSLVRWAWQWTLLIQARIILFLVQLVAGRRSARHLMDSLIVGGVAALVVRAIAATFGLVLVWTAPGLFTWPFSLAAWLWRSFVWRPRWWTSLGSTLAIITLGQMEPVFNLLLLWPGMMCFVGGRWWGISGAAAHIVAIFSGYISHRLQLHGFPVMWSVLVWVLSSRQILGSLLCILLIAVFLVCTPAVPEGQRREDESRSGYGRRRGAAPAAEPEVPTGATGEVARVLGAATHYDVLEIPHDADEPAIRKAKRVKLLATHPDKLGGNAIGANLAVSRVTQALDVLSDPRARKLYNEELQAASLPTASGEDDEPDFFQFGPDGLTIFMPKPSDIPLSRARRCDLCRAMHPARDHDAWVHKDAGFFMDHFRMFTAQNGKVWEITEWAEAMQLLPKAGNMANAHQPAFEIKKEGEKSKPRKAQQPPRPPRPPPSTAGKRGKKGRRKKI